MPFRSTGVRSVLLGLLSFIVLSAWAGLAAAAPLDSTAFEAGRAPFGVQVGDTQVSHRVMAVPLMPNSTVRITVDAGLNSPEYRIGAPAPLTRPLSSSSWRLTAPSEPGLYPIRITNTATNATVQVQVFVLTPWDHEGHRLNGYRIGRYEQTPLHGRAVYAPPKGFVKVTDRNKDVRVSPNFRLEQFLCKQTDDTPQYALVRPRLLRRLERVLAAVNAQGHRASTLHVMSGYRTPYYNRAIGNTTAYSRHLYGDAADIFVDADGDRWMDDLTGDGRSTEADARALAEIVQGLPTPGDEQFNGGLSTYDATSAHGPFVHLDLRGRRARW
jgi:hypothetical protein